MGLFDFFEDVKENADKRREAREYIKLAKDFVREGDEIYERAYGKVIAYASETEYELRQHAEYKNRIAREIGSSTNSTLKNFSQFNIDAKVFTAPAMQNIQPLSKDINIFSSAVSNFAPQPDIPSALDLFISDEDYYEAKRQKDEAKRYRERMKTERERLYASKEKMSEIRSFISSEKRELDSLMEKVRRMTGELQSGMAKKSFTQQEANYLKGIHKITEHIVELLSTEFLTDSFSIAEKYQNVFESVKNINQNLPYAPSISDTGTLDAVKRILDGTIVYSK